MLTAVEKTVSLINQSDVEAHFTASLESGAESSFSVFPEEGVIPASSKLELKLVARCDETIRFADSLVVGIKYGSEIGSTSFLSILSLCIMLISVCSSFFCAVINLSANGTGNPLISTDNLEAMYLGHHFTSQPFTKTFVIENHGRKPRALQWSKMKPKVSFACSVVFLGSCLFSHSTPHTNRSKLLQLLLLQRPLVPRQLLQPMATAHLKSRFFPCHQPRSPSLQRALASL